MVLETVSVSAFAFVHPVCVFITTNQIQCCHSREVFYCIVIILFLKTIINANGENDDESIIRSSNSNSSSGSRNNNFTTRTLINNNSDHQRDIARLSTVKYILNMTFLYIYPPNLEELWADVALFILACTFYLTKDTYSVYR